MRTIFHVNSDSGNMERQRTQLTAAGLAMCVMFLKDALTGINLDFHG